MVQLNRVRELVWIKLIVSLHLMLEKSQLYSCRRSFDRPRQSVLCLSNSTNGIYRNSSADHLLQLDQEARDARVGIWSGTSSVCFYSVLKRLDF